MSSTEFELMKEKLVRLIFESDDEELIKKALERFRNPEKYTEPEDDVE